MSAGVVVQPRLMRKAERASRGEMPIAASTWLGATLPEEQAEPVDTAMPARSSAMVSVSPSRPG